jgi:hypothetical protein
MTHRDAEINRVVFDKRAERKKMATKYVEECLVIMDGSLEAAMRRIGQERFDETVAAVMRALPEAKKELR